MSAARPSILIDGGCWSNERGFGRFARCLVAAMAEQAEPGELALLVDDHTAGTSTFPDDITMVRVHTSVAPSSAAADGGARGPFDIARFSWAAQRARPRAIYFPATYSYFPTARIPVVVTVHDAMAETMPALIVPRRLDRLRWNAKQRMALRAAAHVMTVSEAAAGSVRSHLDVDAARLSVIGEAPDPSFVRQDATFVRERCDALGVPAAYLLYVGGFGPHKNIDALFDAFDLVAPTHRSLALVLVGSLEDPFVSRLDAMRARIAASPHADRILLTGFVPDGDLCALYSGAIATVLPSLDEGFGLTAVESAACGTAVVANDLPSVRASLAGAAVFVDARDPVQLASGLRAVLDDDVRRTAIAADATAAVARLSWSSAAGEVLDRLRSVARV